MLLPCGSASCAAVCAAGDAGTKVFQYLQTQLIVSTKVVNIVISLGLHYSGVVKKKKGKILYLLQIRYLRGERRLVRLDENNEGHEPPEKEVEN